MKNKRKPERKLAYDIEEKNGRYYVYYLQRVPVATLFDIKGTREDAEKAIEEHKAGKHDTQYSAPSR